MTAGSRTWLTTLALASLTHSATRAQAGFLDPTFAGTGVMTLPTADTRFFDVAIQDDGRIVAVGESGYNAPPRAWLVARFQADGSQDATFGAGGLRTLFPAESMSAAYGVAIDRSTGPNAGKIYVAGRLIGPTGNLNFGLARLLPLDGSLDPSFGNGGVVTTSFGKGANDASGAQCVLVQSDGKVLVGGFSRAIGATSTMDFALARYLPTGNLDTSFAGKGKGRLTTSMASQTGIASMALDSTGRIVAGGFGTIDGWYIVRYLANGTLDSSFNGNGKITSGPPLQYARLASVAVVQPGDRVLALGRALFDGEQNFDAVLVRYATDGGIDPTFGTFGVAASGFVGDEQPYFPSLAVQADGRILVSISANHQGSCATQDASSDMTMLRFQADGSLDATFGSGGVAQLDRDHPIPGFLLMGAVAIDAAGRIVVAGAAFQQCVTQHPFAQIARWSGN